MTEEIRKTGKDAPGARTGVPARGGDVFAELRDEVDRLFDSFVGRGRTAFPALFGDAHPTTPRIDVKENEEAVTIEAEIPGLEEKDVSISLRDGVLSMKGEKKVERDEEKDNYHITERSYGRFERSFRVPSTVDEENVAASVDKGVLKIVLPKKPDARKPARQIPIRKA